LLNVITRVYLPGTHEVSLEGSKIDIGVLMDALRDSLPSVWRQIGGDEADQGANGDLRKGPTKHKKIKPLNSAGKPALTVVVTDPNRLPPITLCMTAWFMSCFIGTLPVETVLRVWDVFFYEGSRTLFRIALAIFKVGEAEIKAVRDPMEMFGVVQSIPRKLIDANALMEACYKRRNGIGHMSQEAVDTKRKERRDRIRRWKLEQERSAGEGGGLSGDLVLSPTTAGLDLASSENSVRRKGTLFGRRKEKDQEQGGAVEVM
jgi:hypothetical protein